MGQPSDLLRPACKDFDEDLVLYYYRECPLPECNRIEEHLKECVSCYCFLEDLRTLLPLTVEPKDLPQTFWDSYYQELQNKLAAMEEGESWWRGLFSFLRPWTVPALGSALVLILALTFTFTKSMWRLPGHSAKEEVPPEIRVVENNVDFFEVMDLLESLDLLEALEETRSGRSAVQRL